jgi:hypothetical protein
MKTFCATMEQLRWCRVEDVLRWLHPVDNLEGMDCLWDNTPQTEYAVPCDQFTASVIMRASENLRDKKWKACVWKSSIYDGECDYIAFWDEPKPHHNANVCGSFFAPFFPDPDPTNDITEWTREWVETVLKGMG